MFIITCIFLLFKRKDSFLSITKLFIKLIDMGFPQPKIAEAFSLGIITEDSAIEYINESYNVASNDPIEDTEQNKEPKLFIKLVDMGFPRSNIAYFYDKCKVFPHNKDTESDQNILFYI